MGSVFSSIKLLMIAIQGFINSIISIGEEDIDPTPLKLDNIQGDIILGLPKNVERFTFYQITDVPRFRKSLHAIVPTITTMQQVVNDAATIKQNKDSAAAAGTPTPILPLSGTNIAFSNFGLKKLGRNEDLADENFKGGQKADAIGLGDPTDPKKPSEVAWVPEFKENIDLVILITGDSQERIAERAQFIEKTFGIGTSNASVRVVLTLDGVVRPGAQRGHEHFGYKDGISQPGIDKFTKLNPGQKAVAPGIALLRNTGDALAPFRPDWSTDGSFLVFRYLEQLVPEFNDFVVKHPIVAEGLPPNQGISLAGARMFGRWKSGTPIVLAPLKDDPTIGNDPAKNNDFVFDKTQDVCPFAAHIRKSNPRTDLPDIGVISHRLWRQGIPFGPEVSNEERQEAKTLQSRGLLFACYQSSIKLGFFFVQEAWINTVAFPFQNSGFDPIMGLNGNNPRTMDDPKAQGGSFVLPSDFVVPKGGEYFFSPSISTLRDVFSLKE